MLQAKSPSEQSASAEFFSAFARRHWLLTIVVAVFPTFLLFYKLGSCRTLESHEVYAAVPAREMLDSGNWIVPRFGALPRLEKPPLAYWILAGTSKIFGELDEMT